MTSHHRLFAVLVLATAAGCGGGGDSGITRPIDPPVTVSVPSSIQLQSDAGDWVGGGASYSYSRRNTQVGVSESGGHLTVRLQGDQNWTGDFVMPNTATQLRPGSYTGLARYPFNDPVRGGLNWSGEGRGCNTLDGAFTVDSVTYTAGVLSSLDMRFEQHCERGVTALRGTIHWFAGDTTSPPGPVTPAPAGLWQVPAGALPATGAGVYLESDAGDYIGAGQAYRYAQATSPITVTTSSGRVSVSVGGWNGEFQAMNSLSQLKVGYYPDLHRYPFHNPVKGGLSWNGNGRGCNILTGWFAVDRVTYSGTTLTGLDLRFEQHCEAGTSALRGAVHVGT